jgi:peptidyl-prolyl cis-trans isomerase A (cyclophilin A)
MIRKTIIAVTLCLLLGGLASSVGAAGGNPKVLMVTSLGNVKIELYRKEAPVTVKNFLTYVREGFYGGTIFHRVISGFMVQGGGFTSDMKVKQTGKPIKNEAANGLRNDRGTIAMARTADPNSAAAQFFINLVNNNGLNSPQPDGYGYAVFGRVIEGMDVVDRIAGLRTGMRKGMQDVPIEPVVIRSMKVVK